MKLLNINRTNEINELHTLINRSKDEILRSLENGYKLKKDGSLYEKNRKAIYDIVEKYITNNRQQFYITSTKYSTYLRFKTSFQLQDGNSSYEYLEESVYLIGNDLDLMTGSIRSTKIIGIVGSGFKTLTHKQVQKKYDAIKHLEKKIYGLKEQISNHKKNVRLYLTD